MHVEVEEVSRETKMRKLMCKLWTNFAKYGDPTPEHDNPLNFKWKPLQPLTPTNNTFDYLLIDDDTRMAQNLNKNRMDFWRVIYGKWNRSLVASKL